MQIEVPQCKWKIKQLHQHVVFLIVAEETKKDQKTKEKKCSFTPNQKLLKSIKNSQRKSRSKTPKANEKIIDSNQINFGQKSTKS